MAATVQLGYRIGSTTPGRHFLTGYVAKSSFRKAAPPDPSVARLQRRRRVGARRNVIVKAPGREAAEARAAVSGLAPLRVRPGDRARDRRGREREGSAEPSQQWR